MTRRVTWLVAAAAALAWMPFVTAPLSPDEGGFLLVASQWHPGGSLYGHYWVDRPPLLITIFDLADHSGGAVGLRLIGIAAVLVSVLLTSQLARLATGRATVVPVVVTAAFLTTPLFGTGMVNGELLAVPLVLTGLLALLMAWTSAGRGSYAWAGVAGAAAAAAPLVKQNVVDALVVGGILLLQGVRTWSGRRTLGLGLCIAAGAALTTGAALVWAEARGTEPTLLWDAIVIFRGEADAVISSSSTDSTFQRLLQLLGAAGLTGAPALLAVMLIRLRGCPATDGPPDLRHPALALVLWELVAVSAGGSYWLHYLIGLVPGLVLVSIAAAQRPARLERWTAGVVAFVCLSAAAATVVASVNVPAYSSDAAVAAYLRTHGSTGDTVVVGFGHPNIIWNSGLRSPYPLLWSLPVRVRDPRLEGLTRLMSGPHAPTWVIVNGTSLATWGVDATSAELVLHQRYRTATTIGGYEIWTLRHRTTVVR
jgi:hypothetical protein